VLMKSHLSGFVGFLVGLLLLAFSVSPSLAQSSDNSWSRVNRLAVGTPLIVRTAKDHGIVGRLKSADQDSIVIAKENNDLSIRRDVVERIYLAEHKKKNGAKFATMMTFLGTIILLGAVDEKISHDWPTIIPILGSAGAAALVQVKLTKGFKRGDLIYKFK